MWPDVVLVARSEDLFVAAGFFAVRCVVVSQGVEVRRATDYVCMFGISVIFGSGGVLCNVKSR